MATVREAEDIVRALALGDEDVGRLERAMYRAKGRVYRSTLQRVAAKFGRPVKRVMLSAEIRNALQIEANAQATQAINTLNRFLVDEANRRLELPPNLLARHLDGYMRERVANRSQLIARATAATAQLDAEVSFFRENGYEPEFDFYGPPAQCDTCKALKAGGPHPIERVLEVGYPHLNCRHGWRARTRAQATLRSGGLRPGQISAGRGDTAGIVGADPLLNRVGSQEAAVAALQAMHRD